jgi:hypothetical protein
MDPGDVISATIATVSLLATAILGYRQTRLQARLTSIQETVDARRSRRGSTPTSGR